MSIDFDALDALAQRLMKHRKAHLLREKGFIYRHGRRVMASVIALRRRITDDATHDDALRVAALFHDLGKGIEPHSQSGAVLARDALASLLPAALLEEVVYYIREHTNHRTDNAFAKILQDADVLDHFGALEIAMSFQYGAYTEEGMDASREWYERLYDPYVERTRQRIKYPQSRTIFDEKVAYTRAYIERFLAEMDGAYIAPDNTGHAESGEA